MPPEVDDGPRRSQKQLMSLDAGKRFMLCFALLLQLTLIAVALWPTVAFWQWTAPWASAAWQWTLLIIAALLVFCYAYAVALLIVRVILPVPREGLHSWTPGDKPPGQVALFMFNVLLTKVRHEPPWAGMVLGAITRYWPLEPLYRRVFGPKTPSVAFGDVVLCLDPWHVEGGREIIFGYNCVILCHHYDNRGLYIKGVRIHDHAVIGGESLLMAGVEVGEHAVIGSRSMVMPNTKIGPYEFWAGAPARFIRSLRDDAPEERTEIACEQTRARQPDPVG